MMVTAVLHDNSPPGDAEAAQKAADYLRLAEVNMLMDKLTVQQRQPGLQAPAVMALLTEISALQKEKVDLQKRVQDIRDTR